MEIDIPNDMMEEALSKHGGDKEKAARWCLSQMYGKVTHSVADSVISALNDGHFGDVVELNKLCYCLLPLTEDNSGSDLSQFKCTLCWKPLVHSSFDCMNKSCIFRRITGKRFYICPSCYQQDVKLTLNNVDGRRQQIFVSKLRADISAMS